LELVKRFADTKFRCFPVDEEVPLDGERFIGQLQGEMREALDTLDAGLPKNPDVRIGPKRGGWITLAPLINGASSPTSCS
jgi:hypothetical protein